MFRWISEVQDNSATHKHIVLSCREIRRSRIELANLAAQANEFNGSAHVNSTADLKRSGGAAAPIYVWAVGKTSQSAPDREKPREGRQGKLYLQAWREKDSGITRAGRRAIRCSQKG